MTVFTNGFPFAAAHPFILGDFPGFQCNKTRALQIKGARTNLS